LIFGLGIIILQGVSRRKSLAEVNIMHKKLICGNVSEANFCALTTTPNTRIMALVKM
jgi:hypothetical protein